MSSIFCCCQPPEVSAVWSMSFAVDLAVRSAAPYQDVPAVAAEGHRPQGPWRFPPARPEFFPAPCGILPGGESTNPAGDSRQPVPGPPGRLECLEWPDARQLELMCASMELSVGLHEAIDHFQSDLNTLHNASTEGYFRHQPNRRGHWLDAVRISVATRPMATRAGIGVGRWRAPPSPPLPTSQACAPA